jgi:hypothetical protein
MPELYGQPFKWALRKKIRELETSEMKLEQTERNLRFLWTFEKERREAAESELKELKETLLLLASGPPDKSN